MNRKKDKILIIDDEPMIREVLSNILAEGGDYYVDTAEDGFKAIEKIVSKKEWKGRLKRTKEDVEKIIDEIKIKGETDLNCYNLVVSDIRMPELDGFKTVEFIKKLCPQIKVVLITGFDIEGREEEFKKIEPSALIYKPFKLLDFMDTIRSVLKEEVRRKEIRSKEVKK